MVWIAVSGIDGAGKTGLVDSLECMCREHHSVKRFKHPYFNWVREMIKLAGNDSYTDGLIFCAAIRCEMKLVTNWATKYELLLSQRSWLDHFAYRLVQGESIHNAGKQLAPLNFLVPDITLLLRCDPKRAYYRIKEQRGDKYETLEFMAGLEPAYDEVVRHLGTGCLTDFSYMKLVEIDANRSKEIVLEQAKAELTAWL
jgi:thymidylate kinase